MKNALFQEEHMNMDEIYASLDSFRNAINYADEKDMEV